MLVLAQSVSEMLANGEAVPEDKLAIFAAWLTEADIEAARVPPEPEPEPEPPQPSPEFLAAQAARQKGRRELVQNQLSRLETISRLR